MKKYFSLILLVVTVFTTRAQDETVYKNVVKKITAGFNAGSYDAVYNLLSPDFKGQITQKDFTAFLGRQATLGKITATEYVDNKDGFRVYKTTFDKGVLSLLLACNNKGEIAGFALKPYVVKAVRTTTVTNDNKKMTTLDYAVNKAVTDFFTDTYNAGAVVAVIKDGAVFYYHYGEAKKNSGKLPDNTTIFEIGSISKTFTGILLAQAVIDKKLSLDDDIRKYLPKECATLELDGKPVLIKHLSNHTSGLPRLPSDLDTTPGFNEKDPYAHYTAALYYNFLAKVKLQSVPGTKIEYSNAAVGVLGLILEKVYGQTYEQLLAAYITKPLKMDSTFTNVPEKVQANFSPGYNNGEETPHWKLADTPGFGGIKSTMADMVLYLKANMDNATPAIALSHKATFGKGENVVGLGWFLPTIKTGETVIWHNGGTFGFSSYMGYFKDKELGVIVMANSYGEGEVDKIAKDILRYLLL